MIKKIGKHLKKRKVKIFLVFLLFSSLAWFINKLSESYTSRTTFKLSYVNVPKGYLLKSASKDDLDVKLEAVGFQFLGFGFSAKNISLDVSEAIEENSKFILYNKQVQKQVEKALPNSMVLKDLDKEDVVLELVEIITKNIPVEANIKMSLQKNCLLNGEVEIVPKTIKVTGPINEVNTLKSFKTKLVELEDIGENFSKRIEVILPTELKHTTYEVDNVVVKGDISRFSEKMISNIPVTVVNQPRNKIIKTFPNRVQVLVKAELSVLKAITAKNIKVVADYGAMKSGKEEVALKVSNKPNNVYSATLVQKKATYIITEK